MDAHDTLRRRKPVVNTSGAGVVDTSGAGVVNTSGAGSVTATVAVAVGNVQDYYASEKLCAEAVDKMQAAVSRIDDLKSKIPTIYKVSTDLNGSYKNGGIKPVAVRIGLVNWSEEHDSKLEKLQDYKWYCVQQLINLHSSSILEPARARALLLKCLNTMIDAEPKIRQFYPRPRGDILIDSHSLALMMLLDGCFILHRLLKLAHMEENKAGNNGNGCQHQLCRSDDNSTENLYGSPEEWKFVKCDLLLFENQIPFFVLRMLHDNLEIGDSEHNLVKGSLRLFGSCCSSWMLRSDCSDLDIACCDQVHHLLHLLYLSVALPPAEPSDPAQVSVSMDTQWISCSKELEVAGVRFCKKEKAKSFLDIKFEHGVLEIPPLLLDDFSKALFLNLIAFEKSQPTRRQSLCISNYAAFMADLIKTADDMQILQRHLILMNSTLEDSSFFNGTCTSMFLPSSNNYLLPLMEKLMKHRRHMWDAELMRGYFSRFALPVLGTSASLLGAVFGLYSYYNPRK